MREENTKRKSILKRESLSPEKLFLFEETERWIARYEKREKLYERLFLGVVLAVCAFALSAVFL
jgi:hypothetical protein